MARVGFFNAGRRDTDIPKTEPHPEPPGTDDLTVVGPANVKIGILGGRRIASLRRSLQRKQ